MGQPLPLSYAWQAPVAVSTVSLVVLAGLVVRTGAADWPAAVVVCAALWLALIAVVYLRTRAYLAFDGCDLTVRHYRGFHRVSGATVVRVQQSRTPSGPTHRITAMVDGEPQRYTVPTALLRGGHREFFRWIQTCAPHAELDRGSRQTVGILASRGLR